MGIEELDDAIAAAPRAERAALHLQRLRLIDNRGLGNVDLKEKEALASVTTPSEGIDLRLTLARIALRRGQRDVASRVTSSMRSLISPNDRHRRAQVLRLDAWLKWNAGMTSAAVHLLSEAITLLDTADDREDAAAALNERGLVRVYVGDFASALADHEDALARLGELEAAATRAQILNDLGFTLWNLGHYDDALLALKKALPLRGDDQWGLGITHNNIGNVYRHRGKLDEAEDEYRTAVDYCQRSQNRLYEAIAVNNLGQTMMARGDVVSAISHYQEALALAQLVGDRIREADNHGNLGAAYLAARQPLQAVEALERAVTMRRQMKDTSYLVADLANLACAWSELGDEQNARAAILEVDELFAAGVRGVELEHTVHKTCALVWEALGERAKADAARAKANQRPGDLSKENVQPGEC